MKSIRIPLAFVGLLACSLSLRAQISPVASISPNPIFYGQSVTVTRGGQADAGVAYSEGTIWAPDGSYDTLGQGGLGSEAYTPHGGTGLYWLQFRLVDNNGEFSDQWTSFTVDPSRLVASASVSPGTITTGESVTITRDGQADSGIAYSEGTVWAPDGSYDLLSRGGLGAESFTPHSGAGVYWLQLRLVDNTGNFVDQWISFTVN